MAVLSVRLYGDPILRKVAEGEGRPRAFGARGLGAKVTRHEIDPVDGVLFIDRLPPRARDRIKKRIQKDGLSKSARHPPFALWRIAPGGGLWPARAPP